MTLRRLIVASIVALALASPRPALPQSFTSCTQEGTACSGNSTCCSGNCFESVCTVPSQNVFLGPWSCEPVGDMACRWVAPSATSSTDFGFVFDIPRNDTIGLLIRGRSSQTADLLQWRDSSSTVVGGVDESGQRLFFGTTAPLGSDGLAQTDYSLTFIAPAGSFAGGTGREGFFKWSVSDVTSANDYFAFVNNRDANAKFFPAFFARTTDTADGNLSFVYDAGAGWTTSGTNIAGIQFQIRSGAGNLGSVLRPAFQFTNYDTHLANLDANGAWSLIPRTSGTIPMTIQSASGQTVDLLQVKNFAGTVIANVSSTGTLGTATRLQAGSTTASAATCASVSSDRLYGDVDCDGTVDAGENFLDLAGTVTGTGTTGTVAKWTSSTGIGDGPIAFASSGAATHTVSSSTAHVGFDLVQALGTVSGTQTFQGFRWQPTGTTNSTTTLRGLQFTMTGFSPGQVGAATGVELIVGTGITGATTNLMGFNADMTTTDSGNPFVLEQGMLTTFGDDCSFGGSTVANQIGFELISNHCSIVPDNSYGLRVRALQGTNNHGWAVNDDSNLINDKYIYWGAADSTAVGSRSGAIRMNGTTSFDVEVGTIVRLKTTSTLHTESVGHVFGSCGNTASAATVTVDGCSKVTFTGSTNIDTINTCNSTNNGRILYVTCGGYTGTINDATGNLQMAGNMTCSTNDVLTLLCDGTNFLEVSRSVN